MPLFDICFNFTNSSFRHDEQKVLQRAADAEVNNFLVTGSDAQDSAYAVQLAEQFQNGMFASVGVHPHLAKNWASDTEDILRNLAKSERVKAIGEAGLDYNRNYSTPDDQISAFKKQIELAIELQKPLFLHERDAYADFVNVISPYKSDLGPTVVHCFTGDRLALEKYLSMDFYIGITGWICDERRGLHLQELVDMIPQDRLLIETDAPYLFPRTFYPRPKKMRNEPAYLPHIAEQICSHRGDTISELSHYTMQNSLHFLGMPTQPGVS